MLSYREGIVSSINEKYQDAIWVELETDRGIEKAINYSSLTGNIRVGDRVVFNTTAVELSLGTGGCHFIMYNHSNKSLDLSGKGHIMKLRYTPLQSKVLSVEEENSPYHNIIKDFKSLEGHLVIVGTLHSMLEPLVASLKYLDKTLKINYIMTEDAALPITFSKAVKNLKNKKLIDHTITTGQSFGGDYECVNLYTGLITSKEILKGDVSIVTMGPGIVGTGTKYGFSGINQGHHIDIVNNLGGRAIGVPRISFSDLRDRHRGLSHQSITIFSEITNTRSSIVIPELKGLEKDYVKKQIKDWEINLNHDIIEINGDYIVDVFREFGLTTKTMGRGLYEDLAFFKTLGAVGKYIKMLKG